VAYLLNYEKICNPSLLSKNFVFKQSPCKNDIVCVFYHYNKKNWNLEGSYAFIRSRVEGQKYGEKKNLLWISQATSSSYELPAFPPPPFLHVATPAKVSTDTTAEIMCHIDFILFLKNFLTTYF
jgi:hypothetical protein